MKNLIWIILLVGAAAWLLWPRSHELDPGHEPRCVTEQTYCPDPYHPKNGAVNP